MNPRTDTTDTSTRSGRTASGRSLFAWRGIDFVVGAMLAVGLGVAFWGFDTFLYPVLNGATAGYPPIGGLMLGIWLLPAVAGALLIRRPGAAIYVEIIAAVVEALLGNRWGAAVLVSGFLQGLGVSVAFGLLRWRRFDVSAAMLGGVLAAVFEIAAYEWWSYYPDFSWTQKLVYLGCGMLSGAVIAGLGGFALVRALARAGAVNAFPVAQEARENALR